MPHPAAPSGMDITLTHVDETMLVLITARFHCFREGRYRLRHRRKKLPLLIALTSFRGRPFLVGSDFTFF